MSSNWVDNSGYTHIELWPNGNHKSFIPTIETEWKIGGEIVKVRANRIVKFFENGQLQLCTLCDDVVVTAHKVKVLVKYNTEFEMYDDGSVKKMTIGKQPAGFFRPKDWVYAGQTFHPGMTIEFAQDGKVKSFRT